MADVAINLTGKVKGWNLTAKPTQDTESAYWLEWDWDGWIREQIDYAMSLGANAIRLIGDVAMVINGTGGMTQAIYNTRLAQLVAYCAANGVSVYYTGCATYGAADNGTITAYGAGAQAFADVIKSNIAYVTGGAGGNYTTSLLGCDIVQEANSWANAAAVADLYGKIKPFVPASIGCTFSTYFYDSWLASIIAYCDYIDLHVYPQALGITNEWTTSWVTANPRTDYPTKEILFGEGGASYGQNPSGLTTGNPSYTPTQVNDWYAGLAALGVMSDSKVRGALAWAVHDQGDEYGAFDSTWAPRSAMVLPWLKGWGTQSTPAAPTNLRAVNNALIWDPTGCSTNYASTRLYRNGAQIADQLHARYDDSANLTSKQYRYQASAMTSVPSESAKVEYIHPGRLPRRLLRRRVQATFR